MMTAYDVSDVKAPPRFALTQFTAEEVESFWPSLERTLDTVPHTWKHWTKEYIYSSIMSNNMQVWGVGPPPKATLVLFTTVNVFPALRILTVVWAAGTFDDEMIPLVDATFTSYAKLNTCDEIAVQGRLGWESKLRRVGFRRESAVWTRRVSHDWMN